MARYAPRVASPEQVYFDGPELDLYAAQGTDRYPFVLERWHRFRADLEERLRNQLVAQTEEETTLPRWNGRVQRYNGARGWGSIEDYVGARYNVNINAVLKDAVFGRRGFASGLMVRFTPMTGPRGPWAAAVRVLPPLGSDSSRLQPAEDADRTGRTRPELATKGPERKVPLGTSRKGLDCEAIVSPPERLQDVRVRAVAVEESPREVVSEPSPDGARAMPRPRGVNWAELVWGDEDPEEDDPGEIVVERSALQHRESSTEWHPNGWFRATTYETVATTVTAWAPAQPEQSRQPRTAEERAYKVPRSPPPGGARVTVTEELSRSSGVPASAAIRRRRVAAPAPPRSKSRPKLKPD